MQQWHWLFFTVYHVDTLGDVYFPCARKEIPMPKPIYNTEQQWMDVINKAVSGAWSVVGGTMSVIFSIVSWFLYRLLH